MTIPPSLSSAVLEPAFEMRFRVNVFEDGNEKNDDYYDVTRAVSNIDYELCSRVINIELLDDKDGRTFERIKELMSLKNFNIGLSVLNKDGTVHQSRLFKYCKISSAHGGFSYSSKNPSTMKVALQFGSVTIDRENPLSQS